MKDTTFTDARVDQDPADPTSARYTHGDFYRDTILRTPESLKFRLWQKRRLHRM